MQHAQWIILISMLVSDGIWQPISAAEPVVVTKTFQPSQALFVNPERGWITHRFSNDLWGIENLRNSVEKVSLVLIKIDISAYVTSTHLGSTKLNEIRMALNSCRQQGLKVLLRSAYAWDSVLAPDPENIETMKTHVMDMKAIYYEYEDVIIAVEMGMFGPWGEMHSSRHSTINTKFYYPVKTSALKEIHSAYMSALSPRQPVLIRRPYYIREIFNRSTPLQIEEAYGNSAQARTGYHNDAYLATIDDAGTFGPGWTRAQELAYVNQMTRYTYFGGESFGTPNDVYNNANNALLESKQQHMTYLHRDYSKPIYDAWGNTVKEEFTRKLGYRFELKSLSYSQEVAPGGILSFSLQLQNIGFSAMHRHRPVNLILDNGKTGSARMEYRTTLRVDPRSWTPEAGLISIDCKLRIPAMINEGTWQLHLALPDASAQLQNDGRYAVRFANENVWNTDGTNLLIQAISIRASAPGSRTQDNIFQEIDSSSLIPTTSISRLVAVQTTNELILSATFDKDYSFYQVFIDADRNPATGYLVQGIGADFFVENNNHYQHKGSKGSDWLWQILGGTVTHSINNYQHTWRLSLANLKPFLTSSSQVIFAGTKDNKSDFSAVISIANSN